jgi:hypothetical protein
MREKNLWDRFWNKVEVTTDSSLCWEWKAAKAPNGYGRFGMGSKVIQAHRVAWELIYGSIPDKLYVLHSCDNRGCMNPSHLFLGTYKDNMQDCSRKGRLWQNKVTHCPQGHPYDETNTKWYDGRRYCRQCPKERNKPCLASV